MELGMGLNMLLLVAMVATNIFSLYHLSSIRQPSSLPPPATIPDHLLRELATIRATITHLAAYRSSSSGASNNATIPPELIRFTTDRSVKSPPNPDLGSFFSPIGTACQSHSDLLRRFMDYTPFKNCPDDADLAEQLIVHGCFPLPRRRCFALTTPKPPGPLPSTSFPSSLPAAAVRWSRFSCKSFDCLTRLSRPGFDLSLESPKWMEASSSDPTYFTIAQFFKYAQGANSGPLRLGLDLGGGTGTFAARMKERKVTILSTTLNLGAPYNEVMAVRGMVPLHLTMQQRFPIFDGTMDVVHSGHAVNRWIPATAMEFLFFDVDRVLRSGGILWIDHFFCKAQDLSKVYSSIISKLGYRKLKWVTANKTDFGGTKHGEVYLSAILQKPIRTG